MTKNNKEAIDGENKETTTNQGELAPVDNEISSLLEIETEDYLNFLATAKKLKSYKTTVSISSRYYEFTQPGEQVRGVFLGMTCIRKNTESGPVDLECVQWLSEDGRVYINAGAALVSTFKQFLPPRGCPVQITYEMKKERTKVYDVRILA